MSTFVAPLPRQLFALGLPWHGQFCLCSDDVRRATSDCKMGRKLALASAVFAKAGAFVFVFILRETTSLAFRSRSCGTSGQTIEEPHFCFATGAQ